MSDNKNIMRNMEQKPNRKILKGFKKILAVGLGATALASAQEARPHPDIAKDNPQRKQLQDDEAKDAYAKYDAQRDWIAGVVHSPEYKNKAIKNEGLTTKEVERRREAILRDEVRLNDQFHRLSPGVDGNVDEEGNITVRFGKVSPEVQMLRRHNTIVEKYQNEPIAVHEIEHGITNGNLSSGAQSLYQEAFQTGRNLFFSKYVSSPTELDARKREFEYELEKNSIWKYGETFTAEHLRKALKLDKAGKLGHGASEFLRFLKHEKIPEIMNTVAENKKTNSIVNLA